jgi:hypothetical protein
MGLVLSTVLATKLILNEPAVQTFISTAAEEMKGISNVLMKDVENTYRINQQQNAILSNAVLLILGGIGLSWIVDKVYSYSMQKKDKNYQ